MIPLHLSGIPWEKYFLDDVSDQVSSLCNGTLYRISELEIFHALLAKKTRVSRQGAERYERLLIPQTTKILEEVTAEHGHTEISQGFVYAPEIPD